MSSSGSADRGSGDKGEEQPGGVAKKKRSRVNIDWEALPKWQHPINGDEYFKVEECETVYNLISEQQYKCDPASSGIKLIKQSPQANGTRRLLCYYRTEARGSCPFVVREKYRRDHDDYFYQLGPFPHCIHDDGSKVAAKVRALITTPSKLEKKPKEFRAEYVRAHKDATVDELTRATFTFKKMKSGTAHGKKKLNPTATQQENTANTAHPQENQPIEDANCQQVASLKQQNALLIQEVQLLKQSQANDRAKHDSAIQSLRVELMATINQPQRRTNSSANNPPSNVSPKAYIPPEGAAASAPPVGAAATAPFAGEAGTPTEDNFDPSTVESDTAMEIEPPHGDDLSESNSGNESTLDKQGFCMNCQFPLAKVKRCTFQELVEEHSTANMCHSCAKTRDKALKSFCDEREKGLVNPFNPDMFSPHMFKVGAVNEETMTHIVELKQLVTTTKMLKTYTKLNYTGGNKNGQFKYLVVGLRNRSRLEESSCV